MTEDRSKVLESTIAQIEKEHGKGSIMRLGNRDVLVPVSVIPTGAVSLDAALGVGGIPGGAWWRSSGRNPAARRHGAARDRAGQKRAVRRHSSTPNMRLIRPTPEGGRGCG